MTEDDRYLISRRKEIDKSNNRFIIKSSKGNKYTRIKARQKIS